MNNDRIIKLVELTDLDLHALSFAMTQLCGSMIECHPGAVREGLQEHSRAAYLHARHLQERMRHALGPVTCGCAACCESLPETVDGSPVPVDPIPNTPPAREAN